jgi:hypothetical protein
MRITSGQYFINILQAAFMHADPKIEKKNDNLTVFFALLGSVHAKAAHKTLVKLTPAILKSPIFTSKKQ